LWGLSEAYRLANHFGREVLLDLGDQLVSEIPTQILEYISSQDWLEVCKFNFAKVNIKATPVSEEIYSNQIEHNFIFQGFVPTYDALSNSGLFEEGLLPQFLHHIKPQTTKEYLAVHVRRGDYLNNPHLGVLPKKYFRRALDSFESTQREETLPIIVVGEEKLERNLKMIPGKYKPRVYQDHTSDGILKDFATIANATVSVISNSTMSYLASYFSRSSHIFIPKPFYIAIPGWNEALRNVRTKEVEYTKNAKLRYLYLRAQKKLTEYEDRFFLDWI
jgi:hypothetical protein